jgi:hypothetical protein
MGWDGLRVKAAAETLAQFRGKGQFDAFRQQPTPQHANCDKSERFQPPDQAGKARPQDDRIVRRVQALFEKADGEQPSGLPR